MKKSISRIVLSILAPALLAAAPAAAEQPIKLGTVAPAGSIWDQTLQRLAEGARERSRGEVDVTVYAGGKQGNESTMIRKMRINQLQAAALTLPGLAEIDKAFEVFSIPFFFASYDELRYVLQRLTPVLARRLEERGYHLLHWGEGGWVHLFSVQPVRTVDDLKRLRVFLPAGDPAETALLRRQGFTVVPLAFNDVAVALQTGMIQALPSTPVAALSFQWYRRAPYMLDVPLGPLIGGTVVTRKAWDRLSDAERAALSATAKEAEQRLLAEVPRRDQEAVAEMQKRGLRVTRVDPATRAAWRATADEMAGTMRGGLVPAEFYDLALRARDDYRRGETGGGR